MAQPPQKARPHTKDIIYIHIRFQIATSMDIQSSHSLDVASCNLFEFPPYLFRLFCCKTITGQSASLITRSAVRRRKIRANHPRGFDASTMTSACHFFAPLRIAVACTPSSTAHNARTPADCANRSSGSAFAIASWQSAALSRAGLAGPYCARLRCTTWNSSTCPPVFRAMLTPTRAASKESSERSVGTSISDFRCSPPGRTPPRAVPASATHSESKSSACRSCRQVVFFRATAGKSAPSFCGPG